MDDSIRANVNCEPNGGWGGWRNGGGGNHRSNEQWIFFNVSDKILNNTITGIKIAQHTIDASLCLINNTIDTVKIKDNAIKTSHLQENAITLNKIPDLEITGSKLAENTIPEGKLQNNSVNNGNIKNDAVTETKIINGTPTTIYRYPIFKYKVYLNQCKDGEKFVDLFENTPEEKWILDASM